jgi:dynein light chain LC8-type
MSEDMTQDAVDCASEAMNQFTVQKDMAQFIKKEFDRKYDPKWHVIVGRHFGSYVSYETRNFVYFFIGELAFLIFKAND